MKSIAILGQGFVGGSLTTVFSEKGFTVYVNDITGKIAPGGSDPFSGAKIDSVLNNKAHIERLALTNVVFDEKTGFVNTTLDVPAEHIDQTLVFVKACEAKPDFSRVYFVCLPTPMFDDGECDTSIVERVLGELASVPGDRIAVVKSTIPPGTTERWNKKFETTGLRVVFSPEFLTEANALDDMRNQTRIVLGGPRPHINKVKQVFEQAFPNVPIIKTSSTTAEMVKYFTNIQLAARVVLSCELWQVCEMLDRQGLNIDYDKVVEYAKHDKRLGGTHMTVPGHDGVAGARGHCFPKDLAAIIFMVKKMGFEPKLLEAVQSKNLDLVPPEHRDWEKMIGRAYKKRNA